MFEIINNIVKELSSIKNVVVNQLMNTPHQQFMQPQQFMPPFMPQNMVYNNVLEEVIDSDSDDESDENLDETEVEPELEEKLILDLDVVSDINELGYKLDSSSEVSNTDDDENDDENDEEEDPILLDSDPNIMCDPIIEIEPLIETDQVDFTVSDETLIISEPSVNITPDLIPSTNKDNYRKHSLAELKIMVVSKGLVADASKMKKHELQKLLGIQ